MEKQLANTFNKILNIKDVILILFNCWLHGENKAVTTFVF